MKNILVATYGTTWYIMLELLGFTNPKDFPFYTNHPEKIRIDQLRQEYDIRPIDELWLATTDAKPAQEAFSRYKSWHESHLPHIALHRIYSTDINDIRTLDDCTTIRDLIFRSVLAAHDRAQGGQVILSPLGGYKTLSADIQEAGGIFGCHAMLHILADKSAPRFDKPEELEGSLTAEAAGTVMPIVVYGKKESAAYLYQQELLATSLRENPVLLDTSTPGSESLVTSIAELRRDAAVVLSNFTQNDGDGSPFGGFRSLSLLHPRIIDDLKHHVIGVDATKDEQDLSWLRALPKSELHCHFGGILTPAEMIDVALTEKEKLCELEQGIREFSSWLEAIRQFVQHGDKDELKKLLLPENKRLLRTPFPDVPEPYAICGFLSQFEGHADLLDEIIFEEKRNAASFAAIGIEAYEHLGDLQGSALMQSPKCLRRACQLLIEKCRRDHILYMEVRCSPMNYTHGGMNGAEVVEIMLDELSKSADTVFTLLFIASRHGLMSDVYRHIELAEELFENKYGWPTERADAFRERFVGFDLAGSEQSRSPKELREAFEPLHKRCLNLTIHAGETENVEKIWEAVYFLNADRIGHGLALGDQPELLNRFVEHRTTVELCPSSNFQIIGFKDVQMKETESFKDYPLRHYMTKGIRVTINTDDPGISRTDLSHEYLKAARMTHGGLSKWDVLQLIYNSFSASFAHFSKRREILLQAEKDVIRQLKEQYESR